MVEVVGQAVAEVEEAVEGEAFDLRLIGPTRVRSATTPATVDRERSFATRRGSEEGDEDEEDSAMVARGGGLAVQVSIPSPSGSHFFVIVQLLISDLCKNLSLAQVEVPRTGKVSEIGNPVVT